MSDYDEFVKRMGSFDMDLSLDDIGGESEKQIKHYGVEGMKWGIRRYQPYSKGSGPTGKYIGDAKRRKKLSIKRTTAVKKGTAIGIDKKTKSVKIRRTKTPKKVTSLGIEYESQDKANKRAAKKQAKKASKKENVKSLSNEELQARVHRLNLEKQYSTLSEVNISAGRKLAEGTMKHVGKDIIVNVVKQEAALLIRNALRNTIR